MIAVSQVEGACGAFGVGTMSSSCTELGNETRGQVVSGLEGTSVFIYPHSETACLGSAGAWQESCSCAEINMRKNLNRWLKGAVNGNGGKVGSMPVRRAKVMRIT